MNEATYRSRDLTVKIVASVLAVIGAAIGLWQYADSAQRASRMPVWERQISLYFDATSAAAILATSGDAKRREEAEADFWKLYWGPLAVVEDAEVEAAMVEFGSCLKSGCPQNELRKLSLDLAASCRQSLEESWDLWLGDLRLKGLGENSS